MTLYQNAESGARRHTTQAIAALTENTSLHHTRVSSDTNELLSLKLKTTDSIAQPVRHFTQDPFCDKRMENLSNYKFAENLISGYEYFIGFQVGEYIYPL